MYNRYIPQGDGSYRRSTLPEQPPREGPKKPTPPPPPPREEPCPPPCKEEPPCQNCSRQNRPRNVPRQTKGTEVQSVTGFLRRLLPKDFDTEDLLIVLLLLLISGDCGEDQNTALLTLALYLFL